MLTTAEERALAYKVHHGKKADRVKAVEKLISGNHGLVVKIMRSFPEFRGDLHEEVFQDGMSGLKESVMKYNPKKAVNGDGRLSHYAGHNIRRRIMDGISRRTQTQVHLPERIIGKLTTLSIDDPTVILPGIPDGSNPIDDRERDQALKKVLNMAWSLHLTKRGLRYPAACHRIRTHLERFHGKAWMSEMAGLLRDARLEIEVGRS